MTPRAQWEAATRVSPLTVMVRGVLEWTFPAFLFEDLFARHCLGQWNRKLTIGALTWLMLQVVAGARRSVFAAFQADQSSEAPTISATVQALYTEYGRLDPEYGAAVVRASAERLAPVMRAAAATRCPGWPGYRVRILDGTDLAGTEHRLKVLRGTKAAGLPGRLVVEYDLASGLCLDAEASVDASTSERVLARRIVARAQPDDLYVADRNFCTTALLFGIAERGAHFGVRQHQGLRWRPLETLRFVRRVVDAEVGEQAVKVEEPETGRCRMMRRVVVKLDRPTRQGEMEIARLTNLDSAIDAVAISVLYRRRWMIEGPFAFIKGCLHGEIHGLGRPRAALFAMGMALVAGHAVAVLKQALRISHGEAEFERLSGYYLADEVARNYQAVGVLIAHAGWERLARQAPPVFWAWCLALARQVRTAGYPKHPRGPKKARPPRQSGKGRHHYSTYRLLEGDEEPLKEIPI